MNEIKLYKSSWKGIRLIAITLPFVVFGILLIFSEPSETFEYFMGWFSVSFFGLGIPIGIFVLFDRRPQIIITGNGISDRTLKQGEIKWEQIIEAYPIDIYHQKFISLIVDDTFKFKKKPYRWTQKLYQLVGAQNLNLNLGLIKIDEIKLAELINRIINSEKGERQNHIRVFSSNQKLLPNFDFQNYIIYAFILIILVVVSLSSIIAFMTIMILIGTSALIAKWYRGTNNKSTLYNYARKMAFLGFINMGIILLIFNFYNFVCNKVAIEINNEIVIYKSENGRFPNDIKVICKKLHFNFFQNIIVDKIQYENNGSDYKLKLETLNHNQKDFDADLGEWN